MARFFRLIGVVGLLGAWAVSGLLLPGGAVGQTLKKVPQPTAGKVLPPAFSDLIGLPTNRDLERKLEAVKDYIKSEGWREVTQALQDVLDYPQDCFMPVRRVGAGKDNQVWVGVRSEANRLLGSMPAKGREVYEVLSGGRAGVLLKKAKEQNNVEGLAEVAQRFFHTRAGAEAADLLATNHLDRGRYAMAATSFGRLLQREDLMPTSLFKAALAFRRIGDESAASQAWKRLASQSPDGLAFGERRVSLDELKRILDKQPQLAHKTAARDWLMFGGDPSRGGHGLGHKPLPVNKWQKPTVREATSRGWIDGAIRQLQGRGQAVLPGAFPLAAAGKVVYRSQEGVHAVDPATGELAWESLLKGGFDNPIHLQESNTNIHGQLASWVGNYMQNNPNVLVENSTIGTLSSDGARVFAVEDVAVPPYPLMNFYGNGIMIRPGFGAQPVENNKGFNRNHLLAINLESGKLDWSLGHEGLLKDAVFLGPPLPLEGKLYSLVEKDQELRLVCLEPRENDARVAWMQTLCNFKKPIDQDVGRRVWAAHPAYADGILVCPSNSGAVVAVDLHSHGLLWAHAYVQGSPDPKPAQMKMPNGRIRIVHNRVFVPRLNSNWKNTAPIIVDGKVLVTAPDANSLRCLNLRDGSLLWKADWNSEDCYLAGVCRGKVITVGKQVCRAFNLADGKPMWITPTGMPSGQGVAAGKLYHLPVRTTNDGKGPAIVTLNMETGALVSRMPTPRNEVPGNLIFSQDQVLSQSATALSAFPQGKE